MPGLSEQEIINGCRRNERLYQECLYRAHYSQFLKLCARYARDASDAEQLVNDGFLRIFTKIDSYNGSGSFEGWMKRVVINCCLDYLRSRELKNARITHVNQQPAELDIPVPDTALDGLGYKELINLIQQLPAMTRTVFNLFVFDGMPHKQIAEMLEISEGTSYWHVNQARHLMQKKIFNQEKIQTNYYEGKRIR